MSQNSVIDALPVDEAETIMNASNLPIDKPDAMQRRDAMLPSVPVSAAELAVLTGDRGLEIIKSRTQILEAARKASILMTRPEDWLLHKNNEGVIVGYLQDAGCQRVAPIWGISVFGLSKPEKLPAEGGGFIYIQSGSGHCKLTGQTLNDEEGGRGSKDDVAKYVSGTEQELLVRKCARANLDGRIIRKLTGLSSVPHEELLAVAPNFNWANARKGKGFGSSTDRRSERTGETVGGGQFDMSIPVPKCPKCAGPMWDNRLDKKRGPNSPVFKCKKKGENPDCDAAIWANQLPNNGLKQEEATTPTTKTTATTSAPAEPQATLKDRALENSRSTQGQEEEERQRKLKLVKAQIRSHGWDTAKQTEYLTPYFEASGLDSPETTVLEGLGLDALTEIHEDLKK